MLCALMLLMERQEEWGGDEGMGEEGREGGGKNGGMDGDGDVVPMDL